MTYLSPVVVNYRWICLTVVNYGCIPAQLKNKNKKTPAVVNNHGASKLFFYYYKLISTYTLYLFIHFLLLLCSLICFLHFQSLTRFLYSLDSHHNNWKQNPKKFPSHTQLPCLPTTQNFTIFLLIS